ncbi:phenylalanine--tRNA ligase subunit beta [Patescibacteria group bacterium]
MTIKRMKLAYSWLQDYVKTKKTPEELQKLLTFHTEEVETIERAGQIENVVTGKVLDVEDHPNADKLRVAKVDIGVEEPLTIVCGAPNLEVGQLVPVAVVGAELPGGMKIAKQEVRGQMSEGMICAEDELGLGDGHDSIVVLDESYEIGKPFGPQNGEAVLDASVPANRSDLMSYIGTAREIAAIDNLVLKVPEYQFPQDAGEKLLELEIQDTKICPRYTALVISGIKIGPSPDWMQTRLQAIGLRPINNIVDLTNYLMFDMGQPMHAFDLDKVAGTKMIVRAANEGEEIETLDDQNWKLKKGMPVIQDSEKLIDLAGIMGGKNTEVGDSTKTIILQAAKFDAIAVRQASRALGQRSDAVGVYEKNIDPELTLPTLAKAWAILKEMIPEAEVKQFIDVNSTKQEPRTIEFDVAKVKKLIGVDVSVEEAKSILERLGMRVSVDKVLVVEIPSWRGDIVREEDLVEEIIRIHGFENVPAVLPEGKLVPPDANTELKWERRAKNVLVAAGFNEVINYAFTSADALERLGMETKDHLKVANPISPENSYMRASLIPKLLDNVKENLKNFNEFNIFELGNVFFGYDATKELKYKEAVHQEPKLTGAMVNTRPRESKDKIRSRSFLEAKGVVEEILKHFGMADDRITYEQVDIPSEAFHPGRTAVIRVKVKGKAELEGEYNEEIGMLGEVHPAMLEAHDIDAVVMLFDIDFDNLLKLGTEEKEIATVGKFPGIIRDVAFVLDRSVLVGEVKAVMGYAGGELIEKVDLFDTYEGDQIPDNKKSLAFHVLYQMPDRTLTDKEVDEQHQKVIEAVKERYKATVRE